MKDSNHKARAWLDDATREEIKRFIREAMLTREQIKVLLLRKRKFSNQYIASHTHCDSRTVSRIATEIYHKVNKIIVL